MMDRRDFLLLRVAADREIELSCEQLYMRFVDAQVDGTVPATVREELLALQDVCTATVVHFRNA